MGVGLVILLELPPLDTCVSFRFSQVLDILRSDSAARGTRPFSLVGYLT